MTTNSVFSCDEQDSLDYNGYKLYRLILENPPEHFVQRFPDDFSFYESDGWRICRKC